MSNINPSRLFLASCMALTVTSMTFAIRAGMLGDLGKQFDLSDSQLGWITGMAFFGFPVATTLGGFFVDQVGMRRLMFVAFGAHLLGLLLTIFAGGFWTLFISTFLVGFANGMVEAVCNPLVASMYPNNKTAMLNKFHVWFPGGIVIGALLAAGMKEMGLGWQMQVAVILIPTLLYGWLFLGQLFPRTERVDAGVSTAQMFSAVLSPLFLFMAACMVLTANTELSTTQWIDKLLGHAGANALLILALVNGLMALGRYFGEPLIHRLSPAGVLLASSIFAVAGLYLLRTTEGNGLYMAAIVFALGVCYFWPTMLGFVSENIPKSGALGLSLTGGAGMFGNWAYQTFFIGPKLDAEKAALAVAGTAPENIDLLAGKSVLSSINILPVVLVLAFVGLWFWMKNRK
jgi:MFS family permease